MIFLLLKVSQKQFLEISGISHLVDYEITNQSFTIDDQIIKGSILVILNYYSTKENNVISESKEINYQILINNDKGIEKINLDNIAFQVIDNQGIDVEFELELDVYEIKEKIKDEVLDELDDALSDALDDSRNEESIEQIIEVQEEKIARPEIVEEIEESKSMKDIVNTSDEELMYKLDEGYQTIKIIFTNSEADIERVCELYHKTLAEIYEENDYRVDNRIILKVDEI